MSQIASGMHKVLEKGLEARHAMTQEKQAEERLSLDEWKKKVNEHAKSLCSEAWYVPGLQIGAILFLGALNIGVNSKTVKQMQNIMSKDHWKAFGNITKWCVKNQKEFTEMVGKPFETLYYKAPQYKMQFEENRHRLNRDSEHEFVRHLQEITELLNKAYENYVQQSQRIEVPN